MTFASAGFDVKMDEVSDVILSTFLPTSHSRTVARRLASSSLSRRSLRRCKIKSPESSSFSLSLSLAVAASSESLPFSRMGSPILSRFLSLTFFSLLFIAAFLSAFCLSFSSLSFFVLSCSCFKSSSSFSLKKLRMLIWVNGETNLAVFNEIS